MPGLTNKTLTGYFETEYASDWPGLVTNLPSNRIPPGACFSCSAAVIRGRLQPQPAMFRVQGLAGASVFLPALALGENVCAIANLPSPGNQQGATVFITNLSVYMDYVDPTVTTSTKTFTKIFTFANPYPRYATFGWCVISNTLYFSSSSALGVYALRPTFAIASAEILNPGGYFTSTPTVVFSDGGGTGGTGTATVSGGNLTAIAITAGGSYVSPPILNLNGGATFPLTITGTVAVAVGILSATPNGYQVQEISAFTGVAGMNTGIPGGSNYSAPTVAFIGGGGTGASATAVLSTDGLGSILAIVMNSFGQNYTSAPTVQIIDPTGSGATVPTPVNLFNGLPFIGGDFMAAMNNRLILGNIIGGDGNNTTTIAFPNLVVKGAGYTGFPSVSIVGGGGVNGSIYVLPNSGASSGQILTADLGTLVQFTGIITSTSHTITGVSSLTGVQIGMNLTDLGYGIPSNTTVTGLTPNANLNLTGTFANGNINITSVSSITGVLPGQPITGNLIPPGTSVISASGSTIVMSQGALGNGSALPFQVVVGNSITMSNAATQTTTEQISAYGYVSGNQGTGYYAQPLADVLGNNTIEAQVYPILSGLVQRNSSQTHYPDRVAWSAPNAYGYFDPNWLTAPGGYNTLAEAKGLVASVNVVESVGFIGHSGGITEMTPNTGSSVQPFAFYPLWSADEGVLVRYGSMAQYGTTLAFLAQDTAYTMSPNGLAAIGGNIANLLQNAGLWNNGNFPLQGLYGSFVLIEGELHYLIGLSTDDWNFKQFPILRQTVVYDFNMAENHWHQWTFPSYTLTCPMFQSFDTAEFTASSSAGTQIARDSWILAGMTATTGSLPTHGESASLFDMAPLTRQLQLLSSGQTFIGLGTLNYQFRTESPSIARMQQERRVLIEYENEPTVVTLGDTPTLTLTYTGQQDPTAQTGTVSQQQASTQVLTCLNGGLTVPGQILTAQADFGTFTGVDTTLNVLGVGSNSLVSLVRVTQVADLPKGQVP